MPVPDAFDPSSFNHHDPIPDPVPDPVPEDEPIPDTLRMVTPEDAVRATLNGVVCGLGRDEVRVLTRIAERLKVRAARYGALNVSRDASTFGREEATEMVEDFLAYLAVAWLAQAQAGEVTL